jgi:hypothetical protein
MIFMADAADRIRGRTSWTPEVLRLLYVPLELQALSVRSGGNRAVDY